MLLPKTLMLKLKLVTIYQQLHYKLMHDHLLEYQIFVYLLNQIELRIPLPLLIGQMEHIEIHYKLKFDYKGYRI